VGGLVGEADLEPDLLIARPIRIGVPQPAGQEVPAGEAGVAAAVQLLEPGRAQAHTLEQDAPAAPSLTVRAVQLAVAVAAERGVDLRGALERDRA